MNEFYNVIDHLVLQIKGKESENSYQELKRSQKGQAHLVCWLRIVYNVCISHILRWCLVWGLLVACEEMG